MTEEERKRRREERRKRGPANPNATPVGGGVDPNVAALTQAFGRGIRTRRDISGNPIDPNKPSHGLDWLQANGPGRDSVKAEQARMQDVFSSAQTRAGQAVAAKKRDQSWAKRNDPTIIPQNKPFDIGGGATAMTIKPEHGGGFGFGGLTPQQQEMLKSSLQGGLNQNLAMDGSSVAGQLPYGASDGSDRNQAYSRGSQDFMRDIIQNSVRLPANGQPPGPDFFNQPSFASQGQQETNRQLGDFWQQTEGMVGSSGGQASGQMSQGGASDTPSAGPETFQQNAHLQIGQLMIELMNTQDPVRRRELQNQITQLNTQASLSGVNSGVQNTLSNALFDLFGPMAGGASSRQQVMNQQPMPPAPTQLDQSPMPSPDIMAMLMQPTSKPMQSSVPLPPPSPSMAPSWDQQNMDQYDMPLDPETQAWLAQQSNYQNMDQYDVPIMPVPMGNVSGGELFDQGIQEWLMQQMLQKKAMQNQ